MSGINGKGQRSIKKKSVEESLIPSITFKTIRFMHEATDGETVIDTSSLTAPTDAVNNGFAQPSGSLLGALNLLQYKDKVIVRSTIRPAMIQFIDYRVSGANTIALLVPAQEGEIFEVIVSDDAKSGVTAVDAVPLVKTYTLPAGSTDVSVGPYQVGKYPSEQLGALLVFEDGQIVYRTVGNQSDGEGDFYELNNIIRFVNTSDEDRQIIVVSHSALIEEPQGSLLAMIELLAGQIDGMIPTLAALAGVDETTFQATPNNADLKAFGDRQLAVEQQTDQNTADIALKEAKIVPVCRARLTADQTLTTSISAGIEYNTIAVDNFGGASPGSGGTPFKYTVPAGQGGLYAITGQWWFEAGTWINGSVGHLLVKVNGVYINTAPGGLYVTETAGNYAGLRAAGFTDVIPVEEGDEIEVEMFQNSGSNKTLRGNADNRLNFLNIYKVSA